MLYPLRPIFGYKAPSRMCNLYNPSTNALLSRSTKYQNTQSTIQPLYHSTKFLSFVMSSSNSCKSTSLILFAKLGISVFASSALSQHRLPIQAKSRQPRCPKLPRLFPVPKIVAKLAYQAATSQTTPAPFSTSTSSPQPQYSLFA